MHGTLPLRPRAQSPHQPRITSRSLLGTAPQPASVSTIRLVSATPSATGPAPGLGDISVDDPTPSSPFMSVSSPTSLAPKQDTQAPKRRLVPKKSRLGLLVTRKSSKVQEKNDLSDVVRHVGGCSGPTSVGKSGFEIYVDPAAHSEVKEAHMVKKKKSRAALSGLKWGTLGEVTNTVPPKDPVQTVRLKNEDKEKWWSIGRGRKDPKDKRIGEKENTRVNSSGAPTETVPSRARFNSLDSSIILNATSKSTERLAQVRSASASESPLQDSHLLKDGSHVHTLSCSSPEDVHKPPLLVPPNSATGSIAIRAMRSVRSMARLANWSNGKPIEKEATQPVLLVKKDGPALAKKTKRKEKQKFEVGKDTMISRPPDGGSIAGVPASLDIPPARVSVSRKHGLLGLGFPSGLRFGTVRSSSAGSSGQSTAGSADSLSFDGCGRFSSTASAASSLRPRSTKSRISSSGSASVKWVEDCLDTVKAACRRERVVERQDEAQCDSAGVRSRGTIINMFPEQKSRPVSGKPASESSAPTHILAVEETSVAGHSAPGSEQIATPCRQPRIRPASDQMIGKERLRGMRGDTDGVLSALDAATNELASLIGRLDLEATPGTPVRTPRLLPSSTTLLEETPRPRSSPEMSNALPIRPGTASQSYLQSQKEVTTNAQRHGRQIAPWPVSPPAPLQVSPHDVVIASSACERLTTGLEPSFVSRSLRPAKTNKPTAIAPASSMPSSQERPLTSVTISSARKESSSVKFRPVSKNTSVDLLAENQIELPLSRTFRKVMSALSLRVKGSESSLGPDSIGVPMSNEARKDLGLAGTLGGSMSSRNLEQSINLDDPDSDIPNELQVILTGGDAERLVDFEDTLSSSHPPLARQPPSPGLPPESPLPTPMVSQTSIMHSSGPVISTSWMGGEQIEDHDGSDSSSLGESDTKRSFDFTGELKKLNESTATHRRSFVEQLESAFRTPAKYDLDGFGQFELEEKAIPPVPSIPLLASRRSVSNEHNDPHAVAPTSVPPLLPSPEIVVSKKPGGATSLSRDRVQESSVSSKPFYGKLDLNFKFGGAPPSAEPTERSQLTLSDIIPSPAHARSLSMTSLQADSPTRPPTVPQAMSAPSSPSARRRVNSDSGSKRPIHDDPRGNTHNTHSRASSQISFKGFESFDEIRRGFEFVENRPTFYPPPSFNNRRNQQQRDSMISIASVSSYGIVINPGLKDPFDYGYQSRPASGDMSAFMTMSTSVDDTFSFIRRHPRRKRVDSDSSSFYFRSPGTSLVPRSLKNHFRRDSVMSTASMAPPVSIYNRSFGAHRRVDSVSSVGSGVQAYAAYGFASGNRSSWAPSHRREMSADSVMSDMSVRVSRPALGDKMLESRHDYCLPLTSIAASPPESVTSAPSDAHIRRQGSFDSIMDDERQSYSRDSIMDQSNRRKSATESVFGRDRSHVSRSPLDQFNMSDIRPFSLLSAEGDPFDPKLEDDTMISMIGGGHVHRRSVGSFVEGSPIFIRVGKRKTPRIQGQRHNIVQPSEGLGESPIVAQQAKRSPRGLGEERMLSARQGLLSRDSLEEHCLCADGVDTSFMAEPVFSRPIPVSLSRSNTQSSISSGVDTPSLLSSAETSSVASDSISSIDLSRVNLSLTNMSYPVVQSRTRIRSRGHGHRCRISGIQISRSSVYETIEEENNTSIIDYPPDSVKAPLSPVVDDNVIIVDPDDASTIEWDERGIAALRNYYTLKDEADCAIKESKLLWLDTPFSIYAVQSFKPPAHRSDMRALLEHSQQTYGPISAELRRIRSRTSSRVSPYPQPQRGIKISLSPSAVRPRVPVSEPGPAPVPPAAPVSTTQALRQRAVNINTAAAEMSLLVPGKSAKGDSGLPAQSRLGSNARRNADGWPKRGVGKENKASSRLMTACVPWLQGPLVTNLGGYSPSESLRLNRPRPRGRPAARAIVPIGA
ncbi:hypothetical protein BJV78DRAFT_1339302 [Lactifluus subvellereus]|nr:hypothetical protein BJV78DRAFT_1339302 [Lactifluus subvellereus]